MSLPTYSSKDVNVTWGGEKFVGLAPDSFVTFNKNTDVTDEEVGADGCVSISYLPDNTATCTVTLQQQSESNRVLSAIVLAQQADRRVYSAALTIGDRSGSIIARLDKAHIKQVPETTRSSSTTGSTMAWVFYAQDIKFLSVNEGLAEDADLLNRVTAAVDAIESAVDQL